jgi:predicted metal-dependent phosphoesterase TrpH
MTTDKTLLDLHTHTTASDGKLSPAALIRAAAEKNIRAIAITDHDSTDGLAEAAEEAKKNDIHLVAGVEIEINWNEFSPLGEGFSGAEEDAVRVRREFHLLGLGVDKPSAEFLELMASLRESRAVRNKTMIEKMREAGLPCDLDEIYKISGTSFVGRPHFAEYLVQKKAVKNIETAFKKYFAKGQTLFVPRKGADLARSIRLIKESGGIAILAHPTTLYVSWGHLAGILSKLREAGIDGIEAWHPLTTVHESERLVSLARPLGLCVSAGSDYHGEGRRNRKLGFTSDGTKITADLFDFSPLAAGIAAYSDNVRELFRIIPALLKM